MWSPRQVTHLPPVWDILLPLAYNQKGPMAFSVSSEKHRDTQSVMLTARFLHLKYNMPGPEIEPRSAACQAGVLTTTLPLLVCNGRM